MMNIILNREAERDMYKRVAHITGVKVPNPKTDVQGELEDGNIIEHNTKETLELCILKSNKKKT